MQIPLTQLFTQKSQFAQKSRPDKTVVLVAKGIYRPELPAVFVAVQGSVAVTGTDMLAEAGYSCLREAKRPSLAYV